MAVTWKQTQISSKADILDIIMFMLLAKFEFDGWFLFIKNKELLKNQISP